MSKIKLLLDVVADLRTLADSIQKVSESIVQSDESLTPAAEPPQKEPAVKMEQVRAILAERSQSGKTAAVRELLKKHGATKLSEIDPAEYPMLLADAESL